MITKAVIESLEKELVKVGASGKVALLQKLKLLLSDSSFLGRSDSKDKTYVFQLLSSSALRRQFKINEKIGEPEQKGKSRLTLYFTREANYGWC